MNRKKEFNFEQRLFMVRIKELWKNGFTIKQIALLTGLCEDTIKERIKETKPSTVDRK